VFHDGAFGSATKITPHNIKYEERVKKVREK
jgi:hypothetical protein